MAFFFYCKGYRKIDNRPAGGDSPNLPCASNGLENFVHNLPGRYKSMKIFTWSSLKKLLLLKAM